MLDNTRLTGTTPAAQPTRAKAPAVPQQPAAPIASAVPKPVMQPSSLQLSPAAITAARKPPMLSLGLDQVAKTTKTALPAGWGDVTPADRQANLKKLQSLARELKSQAKPGIALWSEVTRQAVANYDNKQLSPQRKSDFVMQDLAIALVGGDAYKHLKSYDGLPWVRKADPMVKTFFEDWAAMGLPPADGDWDKAGWAGGELDQHACADFRPQINDGSKNQIYHTLFYHFMAYTTQAPFTIHAGSMVHEIKDEGTSSEDHNAAFVGIATGMSMRRLRDGSEAEAALREWPSLTQAAYGKNGGPEIQAKTASPRAREFDAGIEHMLKNQNLVWKAENLSIEGIKVIKHSGSKAIDYLKSIF